MTIGLLIFACLALGSVCAYSLKINLSYMDKIDEIESTIQQSIDTLNEVTEKITEKSKIEVFSDEPLVRDLVQDIKEARDAVVRVASLLDDTISDEEER